MNLLKNIEAAGKCLLVNKKILIISDLHIGYEESLQKKGFLIPRTLFRQTKKEILDILDEIKPEIIVINGDLKHEFGEISRQEWNDTLEVLDILQKKCKKIILIKGNHDKILAPIARKKKMKIMDYYCIDNDICILHGDKIINNREIATCKILIIGHEHPAISLHEEPKSEKYKCFLLGKYKKQKLIVTPSFLPIIEGTDLKKEKLLSPYLHQNLDNFEVFILGDKIYKFGKIKNIK